MKVLYASHTSVLGGGERSLLDLLDALPEEIEATLACPAGPLADAARVQGKSVVAAPGTEGSLRLHPWHTSRALLDLGRAAIALRRLAKKTNADLIHANSIRAGLSAVIARDLGGPPVIVHVRDCLPDGRVSALVRHLVGNRATLVLANSHYTAAHFGADRLPTSVRIAYSPVDLDRFDPQRIDRAEARARLGLDVDTPTLGVVAQITPWKGQHTAIETLAKLREQAPSAQLLIVGEPKFVAVSTRHDNRSYLSHLHRLATELGVGEATSFLGERSDVPAVLRALDLLLVPSEEEPFGRTVIEGMAMGLPVLATDVGGPAEIVTDGHNGILLPPEQPERWAEAAAALLADPPRRASIGAAARHSVAPFSVTAHAKDILDSYRETLEAVRPPASRLASETGKPLLAILSKRSANQIDGIRDYSCWLTDAINHTGATAHLLLHDGKGRKWTPYKPLYDAPLVPDEGAKVSLAEYDTVVLQYNPFMWARWGFAPWLPATVLRLRRRSRRPRIALMVHEPYVHAKSWRWALMGAWQRLQLAALCAGADVVLVSVEAWVQPVRRYAPHRPTIHLPVGSNLPDMRADRAAARRHFNAGEEIIVLATLGTAHPSRHLDYIGRAASAVAAAGHKILLLNLGADVGPLPGLDPRIPVHTPGFLSASNLASALAASDIYLAPLVDGVSTRRTTLMAALQHGLPVVGTDGALTDDCLRRADRALYLVPVGSPDLFAEAVVQLAHDDEDRARLGEAARGLYEQDFAWPVLAQLLLRALDLPVGDPIEIDEGGL